MRLRTSVPTGVVLALMVAALAVQTAAAPVTPDELVSRLRARERTLSEEIVITFTTVKSVLPGYTERSALQIRREETFRSMREMGLPVPGLDRDYESRPQTQTYTLGVQGKRIRVDYDAPELRIVGPGFRIEQKSARSIPVVHFSDGKVFKDFTDDPRYGGKEGSISNECDWSETEILPLQAVGLRLLRPYPDQFEGVLTLSEFFEKARKEGRLDIEEATLSGSDIVCSMATGLLAAPDRPGYFDVIRAYLDPVCGYAPRLIRAGFVHELDDGSTEQNWPARIADMELTELSNGCWFPMKASLILSEKVPVPDEAKPRSQWAEKILDITQVAYEVEDLHVNETPPGYRFRFRFPRGTTVHDARNDKSYTSGSLPRSWTLLLAGLIIAVGGGIGFWLLRRRKQLASYRV